VKFLAGGPSAGGRRVDIGASFRAYWSRVVGAGLLYAELSPHASVHRTARGEAIAPAGPDHVSIWCIDAVSRCVAQIDARHARLDTPLLARGNVTIGWGGGGKIMQGHKERRDAAHFIDAWAPDLSSLLLMGWPMLRYAGARLIDDAPGLLVTAPRNPAARYEAPLNAFLALSPEGLAAFVQDDLMGYSRFNASVRWLGTHCLAFDVDLAGGSQQGARTRIVPLDPVFLPPRRAAPAAPAAPTVVVPSFSPSAAAVLRTDVGSHSIPRLTGEASDETSGNAI